MRRELLEEGKMRENNKISEYQSRLDKTLSSHDLGNEDTLRTLVKDQILSSLNMKSEEFIDEAVQYRTKELSNLLGMLRSASVNDAETLKHGKSSHGAWKVKQDTEELRVMYREGPEGTPFHTLLAEGYVDGPLDVCLCISIEAGLYSKWWPQIAIPTFKVTLSECLKKVRAGEQICLIRMKLSWPLSTREALIHYFVFEYLQDDLVIVLLNSLPDLESIDESTHGFTRDGIPGAHDVVRIDVVGGFALQKVSANRSYFRTIANMDLKLNFVPPSFINFLSRQLIGSGFKLYKTKVASVAQGGEDFGKALKDPLYARMCEALYSENLSITVPDPENIINDTPIQLEEQPTVKDEGRATEEIVPSENLITNSQAENPLIQDGNSRGEIEEVKEENTEESEGLNQEDNRYYYLSHDQFPQRHYADERKEVIRPEVEQALRTLEKAISIFREHVSDEKASSLPGISIEDAQNPDYDAAKEPVPSEADKSRGGRSSAKLLKKEDKEIITLHEPWNSSGSHGSRRLGSSTFSRDTSHNKVTPVLPDDEVPDLHVADHNALHPPENRVSELTVSQEIEKEDNKRIAVAWADDENRARRTESRISRFCCVHSFAR